MNRLALIQRVLPASLLILAVGMLGLGWWAGQQVEQKVVTQAADQTALYINRLISPPLPELAQGAPLSAEHIAQLQRLIGPTPLGHQIVAFKVWDPRGAILFSTEAALIGQQFPIKDELQRALNGEVVYDVSDLEASENVGERVLYSRLLEIYTPVLKPGTNQVTAVVEYYQTVDALEQEVRQAQTSNWTVFGLVTAAAGLLLAGVVTLGDNWAARQMARLAGQLSGLYERLNKNEALRRGARAGGAGLIELHERLLSQIEADLYAGPTQNLAGALLQLDQAVARVEQLPFDSPERTALRDEVKSADQAVRLAYQQIMTTAISLPIPDLTRFTLPAVARRALSEHERVWKALAALDLGEMPEQAPLFVKITLYRMLVEALGQLRGSEARVSLRGDEDSLQIEVTVSGAAPADLNALEWSAIHWRVESLGGQVKLERLDGGTRLSAEIPVREAPLRWS